MITKSLTRCVNAGRRGRRVRAEACSQDCVEKLNQMRTPLANAASILLDERNPQHAIFNDAGTP